MDILESLMSLDLPLLWEGQVDSPFDVVELRIATTVAAFGLGMFALRRAVQHKRQRHFDITAVYLTTFLALVTYVIASSLTSWVRFGTGITTIREAVYVVYHMLTMLSWMLWFMMSTKRGINDDRSEGR